jgi:hypothetical protein
MRSPPEITGLLIGSTATALKLGFRLYYLSHPRQRATCTNTSHEEINFTISIRPFPPLLFPGEFED